MPFKDPGLGIDRTPEKASGLVGNRGMDVVHEIGVRCPCLRSGSDGLSGSANPGCTLCRGRGRVFRDPVAMVGLVTNITVSRFWSQVAWIQPGDLMFSPAPSARRLGDFDKIRMTVPQPVDDQVITRGQETDVSPRPSGLKGNEDALYYEAGREEAAWVEDENGVVYRRGDYRLDGRVIRWLGNGPDIGVQYVVKYEAFTEYIVFATPVDRWDRGRDIGQRVMLRRAVLALDSDFERLQSDLESMLSDDNPFRSENPYRPYGAAFSHGEQNQR